MKCPAASRQRGIALVLVIWMVVLLTIMAGAVMMTQRSGTLAATNLTQERQARYLAEAGLNYLQTWLSERVRPLEQQKWPMDGQLRPWRFGDHSVWIGAMPEAARIDINAADEQLLLGLLQQAGLSLEEATPVRDAILDWRDPDNNRSLEGAEDDDYEREDRPMGARDGNFESVDELQLVAGITPRIYAALAPSLTVYSANRTVDPSFASGTTLSAIPGFTPDLVDSFLHERQAALEQGLPVPPPVGPGGQYFSTNEGVGRMRLMAEVDMAQGGTLRSSVVIDMAQPSAFGAKVLARETGVVGALGRVAEEPPAQ